MGISVNEGGVLTALDTISVNEGGVLQELDSVFANESGVLQEIFSGVPKSIRFRVTTASSSSAVYMTGGSNLYLSVSVPSSYTSAGFSVSCDSIIPAGSVISYSVTTASSKSSMGSGTSGGSLSFPADDKTINFPNPTLSGSETYKTMTATGRYTLLNKGSMTAGVSAGFGGTTTSAPPGYGTFTITFPNGNVAEILV